MGCVSSKPADAQPVSSGSPRAEPAAAPAAVSPRKAPVEPVAVTRTAMIFPASQLQTKYNLKEQLGQYDPIIQ